MFAYAYTDEDKPLSVQLPGLRAITKRIPLRSNSRLLKEKAKPKHKRPLKCESNDEEILPACAQPNGVVAEPLPPQSKSSDGTIDVEEQALLAKYYAKLSQLRQKKASIYKTELCPNTLCWFH